MKHLLDISDIVEDERVESNKMFARLAQRLSGSTRLSEAYECLSRRCGFKDWNTANASGVRFADHIELKLSK